MVLEVVKCVCNKRGRPAAADQAIKPSIQPRFESKSQPMIGMESERFVRIPRAFGWVDIAVVGLLAAFIYALVTVAREWSGPLQQVPEIHLEGRYLPRYALFSLARGVVAYVVSFGFTMIYGYAMARMAGAERVMLPLPALHECPGGNGFFSSTFPSPRPGCSGTA